MTDVGARRVPPMAEHDRTWRERLGGEPLQAAGSPDSIARELADLGRDVRRDGSDAEVVRRLDAQDACGGGRPEADREDGPERQRYFAEHLADTARPDDLLDAVDVLVVNAHEAATIARAASLPADPMDFCVAAADRHALTAIVTLGADGLVAADAKRRFQLPAARVEVVDTTAAGDAFVGALAAALDRGDDLADALADGAASGSYACTRAGAQPSIGPRARWTELARELRAAATVESRP